MAAGLKQKTHKVLDIEVEGVNIVCVVHYDQAMNPYHLQDQNKYANSFYVTLVLQFCIVCDIISRGVTYP